MLHIIPMESRTHMVVGPMTLEELEVLLMEDCEG